MLLGRPPVETLLFVVALAVGLSPELLPAILSVNLARGAQMMARARRAGAAPQRHREPRQHGRAVHRQDRHAHRGRRAARGAYDERGSRRPAVLRARRLQRRARDRPGQPARRRDPARRARRDLAGVAQAREIPFDFVRKRVSVVVADGDGARLHHQGRRSTTCSRSAPAGRRHAARRRRRAPRSSALYEAWSRQGIRVLAVATRALRARRPAYGRDDERDLDLRGFLTFLDRPKEGVGDALADLGALGVSVKLITGDSRLVAQHVAGLVGLRAERVLTGRQLDELHDEALWRAAEQHRPVRRGRSESEGAHHPRAQEDGTRRRLPRRRRERRAGDARGRHQPVGREAVDVAREAADFVLLERDLDVIRRGIEEGRKTFANTLKYVLTTTSANLGNMVSMAVASLFLPFLPLLAGQILLNNFLSDMPAVGIADDSVDPELVERPRRWDMRFIGRFMVEFGLLSSVFDFLTFGAAAVAVPRRRRAVPHRLVRRVAAHRAGHRAGRAHAAAVLPQPARATSLLWSRRRHRADLRDPLSAVCALLGLHAAAGRRRAVAGRNRDPVRRRHGNPEGVLLPAPGVMSPRCAALSSPRPAGRAGSRSRPAGSPPACSSRTGRTGPPARRSACRRAAAAARPARPHGSARSSPA